MSEPTLYFTRIAIDRLDGLEPSGFAIENLEPGINVVYGPNASGKTSLSGAIRQLLAPQERSERFRRSVLRRGSESPDRPYRPPHAPVPA